MRENFRRKDRIIKYVFRPKKAVCLLMSINMARLAVIVVCSTDFVFFLFVFGAFAESPELVLSIFELLHYNSRKCLTLLQSYESG